MRFGCVVKVESIGQNLTMSHWMSLARGCDLGIPYEWYLWQVECLCRMKPQDGGAIEALVFVIPFEKISYSVPPND